MQEPVAPYCLLEAVVRAAEGDETRGFFVVLLTPAIEEGTLPGIDGVLPVAAARGKLGHASGWNVGARHPRPLLNLVPPGSVFFYPWPSQDDRGGVVRRLWLQAVQPRGAAVGFGRSLVGVWR